MDNDLLIHVAIHRGTQLLERQRLWKRTNSIGSSRLSDLRLDDPAVSRAHATLVIASQRVMLQDLRSDITRPETLVNGASIFGAPRVLASGDTLTIGPFQLVVAFGSSAAASDSEPGLAPPPRAVPATMTIAEWLASSSWFALGAYVWLLTMIAVPPIGLWRAQPWLFPPVAAAVLVVLLAIRIARARKRIALLRWGRVARVVAVQSESTNTRWRGVPIPVARGWHVDRSAYSGRGHRNVVKYTADEAPAGAGGEPGLDYRVAAPAQPPEAPYEGWIVVEGREYQGGVILYDARKPSSALCVDAFASDLDRDASGNWMGRLRWGNWISAVALSLVTAGWVAIIVVASLEVYAPAHPAPRHAVEPAAPARPPPKPVRPSR